MSWDWMSASASFGSSARTALAVNRPASRESLREFPSSASHAPIRSGMFAELTFSVISSALRKFSPTNPESASPSWSFFFGISAVCGMGMRNGCRNRAVTANQSARPPIMPASAAARTYPTHVGAPPG